MYLMGIDIGTSSCKVSVFNELGDVIATVSKSYKTYYPNDGWVEQNPEDWWASVCKSINEITENNDIKNNIVGIGVDGQSWAVIALDKNGNVLCPSPIWMDTRASSVCHQWDVSIGKKEIFYLCGNPLSPSYTTPKLAWIKQNMPTIYKNTHVFLQSNGYIVYKLTDALTLDKSQGYGLHCYNTKTNQIDTNMCIEMGLDTEKFPKITESHSVVGTVSSQAAILTGLKAGIPVVAGGLDAACGTLGAGVIKHGQTQEQGGQAGGMSICLDRYIADPQLILSSHVVPGLWLLQGGTVGGGGVIQWFDREFGDGDLASLDIQAQSIPSGSEGMVFLPYLAGERSPIWDVNAKGVYYGLDFSKTKGHFIRASLEGVAYSLRHNIETAKKAGATIAALYTAGGTANSQLWMQIKSDVTSLPLYAASSDTATSLGAAILAGVGTGYYKSFDEAVKKTVHIKNSYKPNRDNKRVYDKNYKIYRNLYQSLIPINEIVAN